MPKKRSLVKESRHVYISVEGDVCESLYFEHLKSLINSSKDGKYNLNLSLKKVAPYSYVKQNAYKQMDKENGKTIPFFHIQDIEDYKDEELKNQFKKLIDDMKKAEKDFSIPTFLGYSNYTFELWMLLHVSDMKAPVANRQAYLRPINKYFNKNYQSLDEYKEEREFRDILRKNITLDSIFKAIERAESICQQKKHDNQRYEQYRNLEIYPDNPYTTVHHVVARILSICGISLPYK